MSLRTRIDRWYPFLLPLSIFTNAWVLYFLLAAPLAQAGYGESDGRLHTLYQSFISPCCWRENLTSHQSPAADQLRSRIAGMVEDGESDSQIKQTLVAEYGKRILSLPEGSPRVWLFGLPTVLMAAGVGGLALLLRHMRRMPAPPIYAGPPAELEPGWDQDEQGWDKE
jgi:cytochrome c-type biogenesis protein CcmH/NrfF